MEGESFKQKLFILKAENPVNLFIPIYLFWSFL